VAKLLSRWISNTGYLNIISFLIIFCGLFLIISILGVIIKYLLNITFLGWVDRICGAGFGVMKGILIVSVLLMIFTAFLPKKTPMIKDSLLAPHVILISEKMVKVVPKDMKSEFTVKLDELKKIWKIR
jgi:membrane protein required for colicin V production